IQAVQEKRFLVRFAPGEREAVQRIFANADGEEERPRIVLSKVICIHLLQKMFSVLAKEFPCAKAMRYEEFCENPGANFQMAAEALSMMWDDGNEASLCRTTQADASSSNPYSIMRNTAEQKARPFKFLSSEER